MQITLSAPDWDKEVQMPGVPGVGETIILNEEQWTVVDVEWNLDGEPSVHVGIDPKQLD